MNVDTPRRIKIKTKGSFKKGLKREGLATVDVNRFPRSQQQQQQRQEEGQQLQQQQEHEQPTKQCSSDNHHDNHTTAAASMMTKCNYSPEDLVTIRQNLSANLTLAKRRMMAKLSQSKLPQDMQMYEYLTTENSDRNKKRRKNIKKKSMKKTTTTTTSTAAAAASMTGGKLKYHRLRPLSTSSYPTAAASPVAGVVAPSSFLPLPQEVASETSVASPTAQEPPSSSSTTTLSPPEPEPEPAVTAEVAEPGVALDILFGGYHEDHLMTTTDEEPSSLCDPSSSPLMPACVRNPEEENEEAMWNMSNHAAGLLSDLLCNNNNDNVSSVLIGTGEPIDFWLQNTMALDQEMSDLLEFD